MQKYKKSNVFFKVKRCLGENNIDVSGVRVNFIVLTSLLLTGTAIVFPYLYNLLVDKVMLKKNSQLLWIVIILMVTVFFAQSLLKVLYLVITYKFKQELSIDIKSLLFNKIIVDNIGNITRLDIGKTQKLIETDGEAISEFLLVHIVEFFLNVIYAVIYALLMILIDPILAVLVFVFFPVILYFSKKIGYIFNNFEKELWSISASNNKYLYNMVTKWKEVKAKNLEKNISEEYYNRLLPEQEKRLRWMKFFALNRLIYEVKNNFVQTVLLYLVGGILIIYQRITIGELLMFMGYTTCYNNYIDFIFTSTTKFLGMQATFDRIFSVLDKEEENVGIEIDNIREIVLKKVSFTYKDSNVCVFDDFQCKFEKNKRYLLTGKSGVGKSTLIKMIMHQLEPDNGSVQVNGIELDKLDERKYFKKIGIVQQETIFFNFSIRDNLKILNPMVTEAEIVSACKIACIDEFIDSLPQNYDTIIGEGGVKLSRGQKQRLSIARLILHKPEFIILDEATSSLDPRLENIIMENIIKYFENCTMLVVSHRGLSTFEFEKNIML